MRYTTLSNTLIIKMMKTMKIRLTKNKIAKFQAKICVANFYAIIVHFYFTLNFSIYTRLKIN